MNPYNIIRSHLEYGHKVEAKIEKEGGFIRRWLCKRGKHIFLRRFWDETDYSKRYEREPHYNLWLYGSYGYVPKDYQGKKMCFWCKAYYKENNKVRDNFYKE